MPKDNRPGDPTPGGERERMSPEDLKASSEDLKNKILGSIKKPYTGEQTARWIISLDDKAAIQNAIAGGGQDLTLNPVAVVDKMFDDFQRYVYEFQQTPAGAECTVQVQRPVPTDQGARKHGEIPTLCQGHVTTNGWALIIFAEHEAVKGFVVPVEYQVGFKDREDTFPPYFVMRGANQRGQFNWTVDGQKVSTDLLNVITKRMFGHLIKVLRGESEYNDSFTLATEKPKPKPVELPKRPELERDDAPQLMSFSNMSNTNPRNPLPQSSGASSGNTEVQAAFDQSARTVVEAFDLLCAQLDHEMDVVAQIGMKAIQAQDLVGAQTTITRSSALKALRQKALDLANEWRSNN